MRRTLWPKISPKFVASMLAGHSSLGLAFGAILFVLCLTGSVLVWDHEIARWEDPTLAARPAASPQEIERAARAGVAKAREMDGVASVFVYAPTEAAPRLTVRAFGRGGAVDRTWRVDDDGGLREGGGTRFLDFLSDLHVYLHLPQRIGFMLVGFLGVALLGSILSGVLSHPRIFKDAFSLRLGGSKRLREADIHNRLSVWALPFHFAVTLTGAVLGLSTLIFGIVSLAAFDGDRARAMEAVFGPRIAADPAPADFPPVAETTAALLARHPGARLERVRLNDAGTQGQQMEIALQIPGHLAPHERFLFNGAGEAVNVAGFVDGAVGQQVLGGLVAVHLGQFAGWPVKLAYTLLGLALTVVTSSGIAIWIARRRARGKPAPGWEKLWIGCVWSQPAAFALTALGVVAGAPFSPLTAYGILTALIIAGGRFAPDAPTLSRVLRAAGGGALIALASAHAVLLGPRAVDPMGATVDAVLALLGLGLLATALARRASHAAHSARPAGPAPSAAE